MEADYYLAADQRFFEPIESRPVVAADFLDLVLSRIDGAWRLARRGIWINCLRGDRMMPLQGWKIHLSSVPEQARAVLEAALAVLLERRTSFKFLADARTLRLTNAKYWTRGGLREVHHHLSGRPRRVQGAARGARRGDPRF